MNQKSKKNAQDQPLVYSCSGCSNIAQLANKVAVELDRAELAEMSCIAGVGGDVPSILKKAKSGRKIITLDGCHLHCAKNCLAKHNITSDHHYTLTDFGLKKRYHTDYLPEEVELIKAKIIEAIEVYEQSND